MDIVSLLTDLYRHPFFWSLIGLLVIWTVVLILTRHFDKFIMAVDERSEAINLDKRALKSIDTVLDICFYAIGIFATLFVLGISEMLYAMLTAFGVLGIVIGFAAKDIISNMFSGIFMIMDQPFLEGDYIEVDKYAGNVRKLSIRSTELERSDGVWITMPNSMLSTKPILNFTMAENRRAELRVSILYKDDVDNALRILNKVAGSDPRTIQDRGISTTVEDVEEYRTILLLRFWVKKDDLTDAKSDVLKAVTKAFTENDVELAVPLRKNV